MASYGWEAQVVQPGDDEANFGRHTYKYPPRDVENIERGFLVKAKKKPDSDF